MEQIKIISYAYDEVLVRTVSDAEEELWFVAKDVRGSWRYRIPAAQ